MKTLFHYPISIYCIAAVAALCIMIIADYLLGAEAEHLNAWAIINRLFGVETGIPNSMAIRHLGLVGATFLMLAINTLLGVILVQLMRLVIYIVHS